MPFELISLNDQRWDDTLSKSNAGVFYSRQFCRFRGGDQSVMFRYQDERGLVFDVTTVKQVPLLPFYSSVSEQFRHPPIDLASPEYNGPVVVSDCNHERDLLGAYRAATDEWCASHNVVTEFVRMHPMSPVADVLGEFENSVSASDMVYVDLRSGYAAARSSYSGKRRQEMNKAARNGAHAKIVQPDPDAILRLSTLYNETMRRKGAKSERFFDAGFFFTLFESLAGQVILVEAFMKDFLASSTVYLLDRKNIWALYKGTVHDLRDSDATLYETDRSIAWAAEHGYDYFLLGGGLQPGDGMYVQKTRFSKTLKTVRHIKKVHQEGVMQLLVQAKCEYDRRNGC